MSVERKVALVTGAGRNIGREIALALASAGIAVAVNVRESVHEGQTVVDEIHAAGGTAMLVPGDVTDRQATDKLVEAIGTAWGRLDILVNNAAVRKEVPFGELSAADWQRTLSVVLDGAFHCTQAALPMLRQSPEGAVINIGGLTAHTGAEDRVHVITAKAGLVGMTRALAHDLAESGITVNCVAPGIIDTVRKTSSSATVPGHHGSRRPLLGRNGSAGDVAGAVAWLAGSQARFVTGQVIHVNGGAYLGG